MARNSVQLDPPSLPATGPIDAVSTGGLLHRQRLAAVLRGLTEGLDLSGAEMWLLDDATSELRVAAADLPDGPTPAPRPLDDARADLTAMAGGAVVLEDAEMVAEWGVDRPCRAAICVPVASDTTIHGSLWLYSARPREFADRELQLVEIAAGRLAVEIERRRLLDAPITRPAPSAAAPRLPSPMPPSDLGELEAAGWSNDGIADRAFHDWKILADGRLLVIAGAVVDTPGGKPGDALLAAQAARVATRCHADTPDAGPLDAGELLTRVSRSVWQATPGGEGLSLTLAIVDPEEFTGTYALAGGAVSLAIRASQTRVEATEAPPIGWDRDERYPSQRFELSLRERLVLAVVDPRQATPMSVDRLASAFRGFSSETHRRMTADRALGVIGEQPDPPHAAVALRWK